MVVREMKIGDGTVAYRGESREYWAATTAHFRRARFLITLALAVCGLVVVGVAAAQPAPQDVAAAALWIIGAALLLAAAGQGVWALSDPTV
jgi:hypothetical protein